MTKCSPSIWHLLHNVKSPVEIWSILVAFLENKNFTFLHNWQHLLGNEGYRNNLMILLCHFLKVGLLLYMIFVHLHYVLIDRYPRFLFVGHLFSFQQRKIFWKNLLQKVILQANPKKHGFVGFPFCTIRISQQYGFNWRPFC